MTTQIQLTSPQSVIYPDSNGKPMADNTKQFRWIVTIQGGLDALFKDEPNVFVAGDLLWYPIEGDNKLCKAPDVMVAFGRPKGDRGSYQQWQENNVAPQVVFEILSSGNRLTETLNKLRFYEQYGVEECYIYEPEAAAVSGYLRSQEKLHEIVEIAGWVSPRLGVRFELGTAGLEIYRPDGQRFATYVQLEQQWELAQKRAERLAAKLQELGIDPNTL